MKPSNMDRLKVLSNSLKAVPTLDTLVSSHTSSIVVYKGDKITGYTLLYIAEVIHVGKFTAEDGATMAEHLHHERELIIVVAGSLIATCRRKKVTVPAGNSILFEPYEVHSIVFVGECEVIALTTPPSPGFPDKEVAPWAGKC